MKIIAGLGALLVVTVGLAHFLLKNLEETELKTIGVEPIDYGDGGPIIWIFDEEGQATIEEKLFQPVREKFTMEDPEEMFSRCGSYVDYSLSSVGDQVLFKEGYYYGTLNVFLGCDDSFTYVFRLSADGSELFVTNEAGEFLSVEEWLKI